MDLDAEVDLFIKGLPKADKDGKAIRQPDAVMAATFKLLCQRTGLSPITRQIYLINRGGAWQPQTSIDGFRAIAARSPEYKGQAGPFWCVMEKDGTKVWTDIPPDAEPYAAKVGVFIAGAPEPTYAVAKFKDYNAGGNMWRKFPSTMIAKCAEALALRKALPVAMAGLYTSEEMDQAEKPEKAPKKPKDPPSTEGNDQPGPGAEVEKYSAMIRSVRDRETLEGKVKAGLSRLSPELQVALSPVYEAQLKELA